MLRTRSHVNFDDIRLEVSQQIQACIASAKIINGGLEAEAFVLFEYVNQMGAARDVFALDYFKNNSLFRKLYLLAASKVERMHASG